MKFASRLFTTIVLSSGAALAQGTPPPATPTQPSPSPTPPAPWQTPNIPARSAEAAPGTKQETLTLARAVEIARKQQPQLAVAKANIEAAEGRVQQVRVVRRPTVNLNAQIGASSGRVFVQGSNASVPFSGFFEPFITSSLGASAGIRLFDFGLTSANIAAAEANAEAVRAQIGTTALDVDTNVQIAFLEAVARQRLIGVAEATVLSEDIHVDQAKRFVAAQAKDPIEVSQAVARAANARSALAQAQSDAAVSLANLRSAMGWVDPNTSFVVDNQWPTPPENEPNNLPSLVATARKERPELIAAEKQIIASEASVTAASRGNRPVLSASASTSWQPNEADWAPDPVWSAGLTLAWPIYDGGAAAAATRIANANLSSVKANRDAILVQLTSEIDLARARIVAQRANVTASTEAVNAARQQLKLAEARYTQGLGSQIELTDAQFAVTTAEGNLVTAEWQLADAWATLRRALGGTA